ncbi:MAG: long-chain fatty acid--CoA ligase [Spiribacter salinus]|uniref:Long-chain fatty acid--CoA ligase n=1 Tax=Spiribacter salinus TaxID=1335746 RepID=A0A540VV35_9GAMM|nr:MAG: long-chain fatty acid--CoA ligase [Spiribacter salinus]
MSQSPTYQNLTIAGGIRASAARSPNKAALALDDRELTYCELVARLNRVGHGAINDLGLSGGRAAILAPNCLEFVELVAGLSEVGVTAVLVNPKLTLDEISFICADSEARVIFAHADLMETAYEVPGIERVIVLGQKYEDWLAQASEVQQHAQVVETDAFAMHYTAGTTGKPKGVLVSHRSRVLTFFGMAVEYGCYGPDSRALGIAPMFHGAGLAFALAPVFFGGFCRILSRFDPEESLRLLAEGGYATTFLVPTHFNAIFKLPQATLNRYRRPAQLQTIVSNAAPLAQAMKERIVDYFGEGILHETYGSTEGGIVTNLRPADQLRKQQCVGLPFAHTEIRLLDDDGRPVPQGEVGELYSRSPYLFNGYWNRPEETSAALRDGWLSVGDLARLDEEGYIYLVDRKKDVIITGGVNVYPREVEECLHTHPSIAEAAVLGVHDDYWGEAVQAFVVIHSDAALDADAVLAHCAQRLANYKLPKVVSFVDALPRNAAGKVLKRELQRN